MGTEPQLLPSMRNVFVGTNKNTLAIRIQGVGAAAAILRNFDHHKYEEQSLISSLANCPMCRGKEPCLMDCRLTDRRPWKECLNKCLGDNPLLLDTFSSIISSEEGSLNGFGSAQSAGPVAA